MRSSDVPSADLWNPTDFLDRVRARVEQVEGEGARDFLEVCRRSDGAFPTLISKFSSAKASASGDFFDRRRPYPSPARGEWYFTTDCAEAISRHLGERPLLLGAPSLAEMRRNATLVDSSPWIADRFEIPETVEVIARPLEDVLDLPQSDSAVIDPPWYGDAIKYWMMRASASVEPGGPILVPLLGSLTRPSAADERVELLREMDRIGAVTVLEGAMEYTTPYFERCALSKGGINLQGPWRLADLAIVRNEHPVEKFTPAASAPGWTDFRVGDHIISARVPEQKQKGAKASGRIEIFATMDSVSRRHPLLHRANLWSSTNRVAFVEDLAEVRSALATWKGATSSHREPLAPVERLVTALLEDPNADTSV
jgi:hypothetical protein